VPARTTLPSQGRQPRHRGHSNGPRPYVDVIDTASLTRVRSIPVDGSVHNVYVTPDGKYAISGSIETKAATVIDLHSEQAVWKLKFDSSVRPNGI